MSKANEDFEAFFRGDFQHKLQAATVPNVPSASWDRKAAYLLWLAYGNVPIKLEWPPIPDATTKMPWE